jgi:hypothetical protein
MFSVYIPSICVKKLKIKIHIRLEGDGAIFLFLVDDVNSFNMKESIFNYTCDISKGMLYGQKRTGTLNFIK